MVPESKFGSCMPFIDGEDGCKDFDVPNDPFPTIYRINEIRKMKVLNEKFHIPYKNRFEEGEFRRRIQFMYGGQIFVLSRFERALRSRCNMLLC
jgi:hypothetical protein